MPIEEPAAQQGGPDEPQAEAPPAGTAAIPEAGAPAQPVVAAEPRRFQPMDFRQPSMFTVTELRKLRQRHDEFMRSLATRLSIYLRLEFGRHRWHRPRRRVVHDDPKLYSHRRRRYRHT